MNVFEIIMNAPFCVVGLLLYSFMATFQGLSTKIWFFPILMASLVVYISFLMRAFSGEVLLESSWQSLLVFDVAILLIALSLYQFKKTHQLAGVNVVSFLFSALAVNSLYQGYGLSVPNVLLGLAVGLELMVWFFIARTKVKIFNQETDSVLLLLGNVTTAVMFIGFFIHIFTSGAAQEPTEMFVVNAMCMAFLCRFLLTRVYLCVKTVYHARNNQDLF